MTNYLRAKRQFLTWLGERAKEKDVGIKVPPRSDYPNYFYRKPDIFGRVRATKRTLKYKTTDMEVEIEDSKNKEFEEVVCVVLRLKGDGFDPDRDDFYLLTLPTVEEQSNWQSSQSRSQLDISFSEDGVESHKNDLEYILHGSGKKEESETSDEDEGLQDLAKRIL